MGCLEVDIVVMLSLRFGGGRYSRLTCEMVLKFKLALAWAVLDPCNPRVWGAEVCGSR
jgi:hypothetical protein